MSHLVFPCRVSWCCGILWRLSPACCVCLQGSRMKKSFSARSSAGEQVSTDLFLPDPAAWFITSAKQSLNELWWVRIHIFYCCTFLFTHEHITTFPRSFSWRNVFLQWMSSTPASSTHNCTRQNSPILETDTTFYACWCNFLFRFASNQRQNMLNVCSLEIFSDKHK